MKEKDLKEILARFGNGQEGINTAELLQAVNNIRKKDKIETAKRRIEAIRRKNFRRLGNGSVKASISYEQMTAYLWQFVLNDKTVKETFSNWLSKEHPEIFNGNTEAINETAK